jgi:hypothetical protein
MAPFLGALAIIALVVITLALFNIFGKNGPRADQRVGRAAVGQNDALQRQGYADIRAQHVPHPARRRGRYSCPATGFGGKAWRTGSPTTSRRGD